MMKSFIDTFHFKTNDGVKRRIQRPQLLGQAVVRKYDNIDKKESEGAFMRRSVIVVIISSLLLASNAFADVSIKWYTLAEGQAKSKAEGKPVIVDFFFGKGCPRCEFLEKEVYSNPSIAKKIMEDFIPIRIDLKKK